VSVKFAKGAMITKRNLGDERLCCRTSPDRDETLLNVEDVAKITGLSVETLAQWRSQRRGIPYIKISRNCVRYRQSDLDSWLVERTVLTDQNRSDRR
jgi:predicted DNA-binding transcriptional regulator AlpA